MALASVYELSPKDFLAEERAANTTVEADKNTGLNWGELIGMAVLTLCAYLVIELTGKYSNWELISASLIIGLTFAFSCVVHGIRETASCLASTSWIIYKPITKNDISNKIAVIKSMHEYCYLVGIVSSLVCGLTILVHTKIDPDHLTDYFTYAIRPLIYGIIVAEFWFRPLKLRLEYILKSSFQSLKEEGVS